MLVSKISNYKFSSNIENIESSFSSLKTKNSRHNVSIFHRYFTSLNYSKIWAISYFGIFRVRMISRNDHRGIALYDLWRIIMDTSAKPFLFTFLFILFILWTVSDNVDFMARMGLCYIIGTAANTLQSCEISFYKYVGV
jgi:hypothetical protein